MTIIQRNSTATVRSISDTAWFLRIRQRFWDADLHFDRAGSRAPIFAIFAAIAIVAQLCLLGPGFNIPKIVSPDHVKIYLTARPLDLVGLAPAIASLLVIVSLTRILFTAVVGLADVILYRKLKGRSFDWDGMFNFAIVNMIFLHTAVFTFLNPAFESLLRRFASLVDYVPTLVRLDGPAAILGACLIGDFCFYWSHRWCHKLRFFWNIGHINHHRAQDLTQLTVAPDPPALFLDAAGGKAFSLLLLPILTKLFSVDARDCVWAIVAAMILDALADPSHSVTLYHAELRFPALRALRLVFVTPAVHFTHHSSEKRHNVSDGCNFAARFSIWDRMFKTYVEPPPYIPETGLFGEDADYCRTPLRFVFQPSVRLFQELRRNELRHWPDILCGRTSYEPPNPANLEP